MAIGRFVAALVPHVEHAEPLIDGIGVDYSDAGSALNEGASFLRMRGNYVVAERMHLHNVRLARRSGTNR